MACDIQSGFICGGQQVSERGWCDEYLYDICYELWGVVVPTRQCLVRQAPDAGSQIWIIANLVSSWATRREEKVTQCGKVPAGPCHFHKHQPELSQTSSVAIPVVWSHLHIMPACSSVETSKRTRSHNTRSDTEEIMLQCWLARQCYSWLYSRLNNYSL